MAIALFAMLIVGLHSHTCSAQSYRNAVLADDPLVYFSFDEIAGPATINAGNLGASHAATAFSSPGFGWAGAIANDPVNRAVRLNGSSDYLTVNSAIGAANFADANYTVEAWVKKDTASGPRDVVALTNAAGSAHGVLLEANAAGQTFRYLHRFPLGGGGGENINPTAQTFNIDQWHHVAIVNDGNAMRFYLDGNLDSVTNTSSAAINADLTATLGRLTNTLSARYFDGFIDEVAIYDGALSQTQIQSHIDAASAFAPGDVQRTPALAVDFGGATQMVEPGFEAFTRADATTGTQSESYASPFAATGTDITVSVDAVGGFRNRDNMSGPDGDLGESFVFRDNSLTLTLSNLAEGDYELLTYHHDSDFPQSNFNVLVTDANGTDILALTDVLSGTGTSPSDIALTELDIVADGVNDVIIEFVEAGTQPRPVTVIPLSGFELNQITAAVPEPGAIAIWVLLAGIAGAWGWSRRRGRSA